MSACTQETHEAKKAAVWCSDLVYRGVHDYQVMLLDAFDCPQCGSTINLEVPR